MNQATPPTGGARRPPLRFILGALGGALAGAWLGASCLSERPDPAEARARGLAALRDGRIHEAEAMLPHWQPTGPADRLARAEIWLTLDRPADAQRELEAIPEGLPESSQAWLARGRAALKLYRAVPAEAALQRALQLDPELEPARRALVYLYGTQRRRREYREQFRELATRKRLSLESVLYWCLPSAGGSPGQVLADLRRFVAADPADRASRLALAEQENEAGRPAEALSVLEPLGPDDPDARATRAAIALQEGDDATAQSLLAGGPADHPGLERLRGRQSLVAGRYAEAVAHLSAASRAEPDHRETLFSLSYALRGAGRITEADAVLRKAQDVETLGILLQRVLAAGAATDAETLRALGRTCAAIGRPSEARAWYLLALDRDPGDRDTHTALARLGLAQSESRQPGDSGPRPD